MTSMLPTAAADVHGDGPGAGDGCVLLDLAHDRLLKLNPVASEICQRLAAGQTEPAIARALAHEYGVEEHRVAADVRALRRQLAALGVAPELAAPPPLRAGGRPGAPPRAFPWYGQDGTAVRRRPRALLVLGALLGLATCELVLATGSLAALCAAVRRVPVRRPRRPSATSDRVAENRVAEICAAVERACIWYPRPALCLPRSAVTTGLLRCAGIPARLVLGARPMPFLAHAWVEVDGAVVNDWPRVQQFYPALASY